MPIQRTALVSSVVTALICVVVAAQPPQRPPATPDPNRQVFRLGVELVQVDAVVTDARGRHVTDLTIEDFEIIQDGRLQPVSAFAYVQGPRRASPQAPPPARRSGRQGR